MNPKVCGQGNRGGQGEDRSDPRGSHQSGRGASNKQPQKVFKPADIGEAWALVIYDGRNFREPEAQKLIYDLKAQADLLGIRGVNASPYISYPCAQAMNIVNDLDAAGRQVIRRTGKPPTLFVIVLPDCSADIYQAVKYFGDVFRGVTTQCISSKKIKVCHPHYWTNLCLKINAKLGGVNSKLDSNDPNLKFILDVANPTMILGADVLDAAPGTRDRPSIASVVGSIDSHAAHYSAVSAAYSFRAEMITSVESMVYELIGRHAWWKQNKEGGKVHFPKRIIYYRSVFSEGQFQQILNVDLPAIKAACQRHRINPTVTVVVVDKCHHLRFFPKHGIDERSGTCRAGTVVDDGVGHPTVSEFYLQSCGGPPGTSSSVHYSVLHDENHFTSDCLEALSYALCRIYARETHSVRIPAPVHYAYIVCKRSKNHYHPSIGCDPVNKTEIIASGTETSGALHCNELYENTHASLHYKMYFH